MTENREGVCTYREVLYMLGVNGISLEAALFALVGSVIATSSQRVFGESRVIFDNLGAYLRDLGLNTVIIGDFALTPKEQLALSFVLVGGIMVYFTQKLSQKVIKDAQVGKLGGERELFSIRKILHL